MEVPTKGKGTGTRLATQPAPAPIRLKATLLRHGIRHDEVADRLIQAGGSRAGQPLSRSAFTLLLNSGWRPSHTPWPQITAGSGASWPARRRTIRFSSLVPRPHLLP